MRDLVNNIKAVAAIKQQSTVVASGNGEVVDTQGYQSVTFLVQAGASVTANAANKLTFYMEEGDLANGSDMAEITDTDRIMGTVALDADTDADTVQKLGLVLQNKRYVRLSYTATVESPNLLDADFAAVAVLGHPLHAAVA